MECMARHTQRSDLLTLWLNLPVSAMQGIELCSSWTASAASAIVSRLTLLSLHDNGLTELADVLPASAVQSLRVLDLSGNCFGEGPHDEEPPWAAENMAAFARATGQTCKCWASGP